MSDLYKYYYDGKKQQTQPEETTEETTGGILDTYRNYVEGVEAGNAWAEKEIGTPEFAEKYREFAKQRPEITTQTDWDNLTYEELRRDFFHNGTWRNNNTASVMREMYDLGELDEKQLKDWEYLERVFHAAPVYGKYRTGWEATMDIGGAVVSDPLNIFGGVGIWGKPLTKTTQKLAKQGYAAVNKTFLMNEVKKQAAKDGAVSAAKWNFYGGAIFDVAKQTNMKIANEDYDYDWSRTAITSTFSGLAGLPIGYGLNRALNSRVNPNTYFKKGTDWVSIDSVGWHNGKPVFAMDKQKGYTATKEGVNVDIPIDKGTVVTTADGTMGEVIQTKTVTTKEQVKKEVTIEYTDKKGKKKTKVVDENKLFVQDVEVLPRDLAGATPKYNFRDEPVELEFEDDIVKALYIVGGRGKSARHDDYLSFLESNGVKNIKAQAQALRDYIKGEAKAGFRDVKIAAHRVERDIPIPKNVERIDADGLLISNKLEGEAKAINKQADDVSWNRDVFINKNKFDKITGENYEKIVKYLKENYNEIKGTNKYLLDFRTRTRKLNEMLDEVETKVQMKLDQKSRDDLLEDLTNWAKTGQDGGVNLISARYQMAADLKTLSEKLALYKKAGTKFGKEESDKQVDKAFMDVLESMSIHDKIQTQLSDNLQAAKIKTDVTPAARIKQDYINKSVKKLLEDKRLKQLDPKAVSEIKENIVKNLDNQDKMVSVLRKYEQLDGDAKLTGFGAWFNEWTTANLLWDTTTHTINIASGILKWHWTLANQYMTVARIGVKGQVVKFTSFSPEKKAQAQRQIKMAEEILAMSNDQFISEWSTFRTALRHAMLAIRKNTAVGDIYHSKYHEGRVEKVHEMYMARLEKSTIAKRAAAKVLSPLSSAVYNSFKLLAAGDTLLKQTYFRASTYAMINHRMRTEFPDLWAKHVGDKGLVSKAASKRKIRKNISLQGHIDSLEQAIAFEEASKGNRRFTPSVAWRKEGIQRINMFMTKKDRIEYYKSEIERLEVQKKATKDEFTETYQKLWNEYQDEFGNFVSTDTFSNSKLESMDDLSRSLIFDPTQRARRDTFTDDLINPLAPTAKDPIFGNTGGVSQYILDWAYRNPLLKTSLGINFIKTPVQLNRFMWHHTPILNKLHFQYKEMLNSDDPYVRHHAESTQALGIALIGWSATMYSSGRLIGHHSDTDKSDSIVLEDGSTVKFDRLYPLTGLLKFTARVGDVTKDLGHIWNDPLHTEANEKFWDTVSHVNGGLLSVLNVTLNSQLVTNQAFDVLEGLLGQFGNERERKDAARTVKKFFGSTAAKTMPAATGFRRATRELADADFEINTEIERWYESTPMALYEEITGTAFQPKRGRTYKIKNKTQGFVPFYGATDWDNIFKFSAEDVKDVFKTQEGLESYLEVASDFPRIDTTVSTSGITGDIEIGDLLDYNVSSYIDPNTGKNIVPDRTQTFADLRLQLAGEMKIDGKTIEDTLSDMFDDPMSPYHRFYPKKQIGGKRPDEAVVKEIHSIYESLAKDWVIQNAYAKVKNKEITPFYEEMLKVNEILTKALKDNEKDYEARLKTILKK